MNDVVVATLYHFARFPDFESFREPLLERMRASGVRGTLLLAPEGINGTIAGPRPGVDAVIGLIRGDRRFAAIEVKESAAVAIPFHRAKVKLKREIVTMGVEDIDPAHISGTYVEPKDWNALISDPEVTLVDTRNDYEYRIGTFKGALNPQTDSFRQFPEFVSRELDPQQNRKVAMFCTGGIRCEKSTAYLKQQGFEEVYHLKGGILKYLQEVPRGQSLWEGECFVFDNRVTLNHDLQQGAFDQCHACRMPVSEADRLSEHYVQGVSCPHCHDRHSGQRLLQFRERERQIMLASARGEQHVGLPMDELIRQRRQAKRQTKEVQRRREKLKLKREPARG